MEMVLFKTICATEKRKKREKRKAEEIPLTLLVRGCYESYPLIYICSSEDAVFVVSVKAEVDSESPAKGGGLIPVEIRL